MVIDKVGNVNNVYDAKRPKGVSKSGQADQTADKVQISNEALKAVEDARYTQTVRETPDVRAEKVNEIKAKIASGEYDKDIDNKILNLVADKILTQLLHK
jgi:negative regulator of flagellin synthesis FlgM